MRGDIVETLVNPSCNDVNGSANGSITIVPSGGVAPYTFAWTGPGVAATAQDQTGLGAGTYCNDRCDDTLYLHGDV